MTSACDFSFTGIDGKQIHLRDYAGKAMLVVMGAAAVMMFVPS